MGRFERKSLPAYASLGKYENSKCSNVPQDCCKVSNTEKKTKQSRKKATGDAPCPCYFLWCCEFICRCLGPTQPTDRPTMDPMDHSPTRMLFNRNRIPNKLIILNRTLSYAVLCSARADRGSLKHGWKLKRSIQQRPCG